MATHVLQRRASALGTVLGLSAVLTLGLGATPAAAVAQLRITKTHVGTFPRGGIGEYTIKVSNRGDSFTQAGTTLGDALPEGLTVADYRIATTDDTTVDCSGSRGSNVLRCSTTRVYAAPTSGFTIVLTVDVANDAPCSVTNVVAVRDDTTGIAASATDPTTITGGDCPNGGGGGSGNGDGGSILPVNLSGLIPVYNNINTNSNFNSPGASNSNSQAYTATAP
ncbi:uncharacterized repeat protein (TIGR01451 family) [Streptomyces sp. TLI_55]|uniref:DUF11 domain-containing protein n=1 Tax=Streptomyces sp. TLI_55 TaxID=1938861 RepID=UPI000BDB08A3|nr:DUF11 domain-containing protein [Streptomyces sp. TLI_55]SNX88177.1 uncharacterized repeat protein (TIGR01451 family) [Streptomyces sp. TLI_55]